jgi:hypothetical protein
MYLCASHVNDSFFFFFPEQMTGWFILVSWKPIYELVLDELLIDHL